MLSLDKVFGKYALILSLEPTEPSLSISLYMYMLSSENPSLHDNSDLASCSGSDTLFLKECAYNDLLSQVLSSLDPHLRL
ncbi:hypothetical protein HMI56_005678 [Coelomomyces lativittatus]|nr:hypothetical protein HMI56_005678 [Coelomomyces lativittatus]